MVYPPLSYRPKDEDYEFLHKAGIINNWSDTVDRWIKQEQKQHRTVQFERLQNSILLIIFGVFIYILSFIVYPFYSVGSLFIVIVIYVCAVICVTYGTAMIYWRWRHG